MMKKGKGYHDHVKPDVKGVTKGYIMYRFLIVLRLVM